MINLIAPFTLFIFLITVFFIVWRPRRINETLPTSIGAAIFLLFGIVPFGDIFTILDTVGGAAITILTTIVMSIVLESIGFFRWAAFNIVNKSKGSGVILFLYVMLLCFLMTLFFNNDGSVLITTPIIIHILSILNLKLHQKIPYLISGVLIATASSAPIGVSNLANLIALKIVGLSLNSYAAMMFVPTMIGIVFMAWLLYLYFKKDLPKQISISPGTSYLEKNNISEITLDFWMLRVCLTIVIIIRGSFFALSPLGIPIQWIGIIGALLLIIVRWYRKGIGPLDVIKKTPFHIIIFAFSMYVLIYGLHNVGYTTILIETLREPVSTNLFNASLIMGIVVTILSNLCNNLPAVMIGTLSITEMGLDLQTMQVAYLASVIGADIGALLLPMGTLATLIWMFIIRKNGIEITWSQYCKVTIIIIPIPLLISLISLYLWTGLLLF